MISSKTLRIAGAAILGTLVGTGSAYAQIYNDGDGEIQREVTIANESLTTYTTVEGARYYNLAGYTSASVRHKLGVNVAAGQTARIDYAFENMVVVADDLLNVPAKLALFTTATGNTAAGGTPVIAHITGGGAKANTISFSVTGGSAAIPSDTYVQLDIDQFGLLSSASGGTTGSVTMTTTYLVAGTPVTASETLTDAFKTKNILTETAVPATPRADVSTGFTRFSAGTGASAASVGTLQLSANRSDGGRGVVTQHSTGWQPSTLDTGGNGDIVDSGTVEFAGDLSFVENVTIDASPDCDTSGATSLVENNEDRTGKIWKSGADLAAVSDFASAQYICIHVDGDTVIPVTDAYTATTSYESLASAAFPPRGQTLTLGGVGRAGVNVYIPYLTTASGYNQRLVIRNRGSSAVRYSMTFQPEDGITASAGEMASGTLQPGTTMLSVKNDDVVTLTGGSRTAATLNLETLGTSVDVATVQVNLSDGSTDTVTYTASTGD